MQSETSSSKLSSNEKLVGRISSEAASSEATLSGGPSTGSNGASSGSLSSSFFSRTIFTKTFLRFWPIWASCLVIWTIAIPLRGLSWLQATRTHPDGSYFRDFIQGSIGSAGCVPALAMAGAFGLIAAMAVFSHLYNPRSANFMGSLPVRREALFCSHYLAGLAMLVLPNVLVFLVTIPLELVGGVSDWQDLAFWLASSCGMSLFFYSFAVFLGMFCGRVVALSVFYGIFNFLVAALYSLLGSVCDGLLYGFQQFPDAVQDAVVWFTPAIKLVERFSYIDFYPSVSSDAAAYAAEQATRISSALGTVGIYAIVGVAFVLLSLLLYRRRRLETAGDIVSVRVMRPVFKYGVGVCTGLAFGVFTAAYLELGESRLSLAVCIIVWAVVGYFVAQMLLDKSFRVLDTWKGATAMAVVLAVGIVLVVLDPVGFQSRVPQADDVESVAITGPYTRPYDSGSYTTATIENTDAIADVVELHQALVDERNLAEESAAEGATAVTLTYDLKDGTILRRDYMTPIWKGDESDEIQSAMTALCANRDFVWALYGLDHVEGNPTQAEVTLGDGVAYADENYYEAMVGTYTANDAALIYTAVMEDFRAGGICVRYPETYSEDMQDSTDSAGSASGLSENAIIGSGAERASGGSAAETVPGSNAGEPLMLFLYWPDESGDPESFGLEIQISVPTTATNTIDALATLAPANTAA